jgi:hypothetical protein
MFYSVGKTDIPANSIWGGKLSIPWFLVAINLPAIHHSQWNHDFSGSLMIQLTR